MTQNSLLGTTYKMSHLITLDTSMAGVLLVGLVVQKGLENTLKTEVTHASRST